VQASRDEIFIGGKCFSLSYFAVKMVGRISRGSWLVARGSWLVVRE